MSTYIQAKKYLDETRHRAHEINGGEVMITGQYWNEWIQQNRKEKENHEALLQIIKSGMAYERRKVWKQLRCDLEWRYLLKIA